MEEKTAWEAAQETLCRLGQSGFFIVMLLVGVVISYSVLERQRRQTCLALAGDDAGARRCGEAALEMRTVSSALVTGSLGFFLLLAERSCAEAAVGGDNAACRSAGRNLWASMLVFAAALIRLYDLSSQRCDAREKTCETEQGGGSCGLFGPGAAGAADPM